jgi:hypothetical protein
MTELTSWKLTDAEQASLKARLSQLDDTFPFHHDPEFASTVAAVGMQREVGTHNDDIARFLFDHKSGELIDRKSLRVQLVRYRNNVGVKIWSTMTDAIEVRFKGFTEYINPQFSYDADGRLKQLVIFPQSVCQILALHGVEAVIVKPWAMNTIFGGFNPQDNFYQTNMWELANNDTVRFSELVAARQVPFLGTHDFIAHIVGTDGARWQTLAPRGDEVHKTLQHYFAGVMHPSLPALILPYVAGVLLDDLAQPPSYDDPTRSIPLRYVMDAISSREIAPNSKQVLTRFPTSFEKLIDLARLRPLVEVRESAKKLVDNLVAEIRQNSLILS